MNKPETVDAISQVLRDLQAISGREAQQITQNTCPIGELDQFDSLNGVEATIELSDKLGLEIPGINIFVSEDGTKARTVAEIADWICKLAASKESK